MFLGAHHYRFFALLVAWLVTWLVAFNTAHSNAVHHWLTNEIFHHGIFVVPIFLWALWRDNLLTVPIQFSISGLLASISLIVIWYIGYLAQLTVIEQLAAVALVSTSAATVFGWQFVIRAWFPLTILFFGIPIGQEFIPLLQVITVNLAKLVLLGTGATIYVEELYIHTAAGVFHVAEACSGVKFLVACAFLGYVCAYLYFESVKSRVAFLTACLVIPVLANAVRVVITVLVGTWFGIEHVEGFDHLVYGWVLFAFVFGAIIWLALRLGTMRETLSRSEYLPDSKSQFAVAAFFPLILVLFLQSPIVDRLVQSEISDTPQLYDCNQFWLDESSTMDVEFSWVWECNEKQGALAVFNDGSDQSKEIGSVFGPVKTILGVGAIQEAPNANLPPQFNTLAFERLDERYVAVYWYQVSDSVYASPTIPMKLHQLVNTVKGKGRGAMFFFTFSRVDFDASLTVAKSKLSTKAHRLVRQFGNLPYSEKRAN